MEKNPLSSFIKSPIQKKDIEPEEEVEFKFLRGKKGEDGIGEKGEKGEDVDPNEVVRLLKADKGFIANTKAEPYKLSKEDKESIISFIKVPVVEKIIERVEVIREIPTITNEIKEVAKTDTSKEIIEKINSSRSLKIKRDKIDGFDELDGMIRGQSRQIQNIASLGGTRQTAIKASGVLKGTGIQTLNFTNATVTPVGDGSEADVTVVSTSGGTEKPVGTINGTNVTFTVSNTPKYILVDGVAKLPIAGQLDGSVGYTYATGTITITDGSPPTNTIYSIF
jgi:hypothetical protein